MNDRTDSQLLRAYAEGRSEPAFAELVRRRVDFVYSAALRMVCDSHLAEDVTQGVFVALAKNVNQLTNRPVLSGWLHRTAQNIAAQTVRTDVRRRAREQEAAAMNDLLAAEPDAPWEHIAPHLDAALGELSEPDRDAVLLRYFERKSAREMAAALGVSEEAAQKRVSRAVERLREFFAKRGVTVGAGGLVVVISANAVQAAPAGLAVTISTAAALAGTTIAATATATAVKAIAMTTLQKTLITATVAVLAGAGIYEARQASTLRNQVQTFQQQQAPLAEQIEQLQRERDAATNRLAGLFAENARLRSNPIQSELLRLRGEVTQLKTAEMQKKSDPIEAVANARAAKVNQLKQRLEQMPNGKIPELQYLTAQDWLRGATYGGELKTDDEFDRALSQLRRDAKRTFAYSIGEALANYIAGNNGSLPGDISQLELHFNPPIDGTILQRYQVLQTGNLSDISINDPLIAEKAPVDDQYDTLFRIGATGFSYQGTGISWVNGSGKGGFGTNITAKIKPFERQN
ncbi:MAG: sigma-70 family RNA polymerase sigma factor [Verrucomicrobia bacterium]|nr:sigma-70 family RNA polymerase sigma factor [Verrucomicrobiota bacterium]